MKQYYNRILMLLTVIVFSGVTPSILGQTTPPSPATAEPQQRAFGADPIQQLNLTPEQRQQIRSIRENNKADRAAINEQLREANRALEEALNSDNPDEALVEQRLRSVAAAQAAATRMRILTEIRIRRVLTLEQRNILRSLQQQARESRRERMLANPEARQKRLEERSRALENRRNGLGPLLRQRGNQRRPRL
ncbi:MAG TPA: Spy/CpxP family protein refolding chaperone [Pyrinomonadaceae bacterium]|nr:Spy/CpxP family protein refolding chaperone [Pyrinomonadaceae bacterium]